MGTPNDHEMLKSYVSCILNKTCDHPEVAASLKAAVAVLASYGFIAVQDLRRQDGDVTIADLIDGFRAVAAVLEEALEDGTVLRFAMENYDQYPTGRRETTAQGDAS